MKRAYFDSSCMLAILLDEPLAAQSSGLWEKCEERVSSILFEAECNVTLRRYAIRAPEKLSTEGLAERTMFLNRQLELITLQDVDGDILSLLRNDASLTDCRTLDALHLATALFFQKRSDEEMYVVSFDKKMRETASKIGFEVAPRVI